MRILLSAYSFFSRAACRLKRAAYRRGLARGEHAPLPVISVGNLALGGTEKTPLVLELLSFWLDQGFQPALVTRGYKGAWEKTGGVLSDGRTIFGGWREGGDEPFLAATLVPGAGVFVGRDRAASCRRAAESGFDIAVLDDGFQHLRLERDLDIVLYDPSSRTPLREGRPALADADIVLLKRAGDGTAPPPFPGKRPRTWVFAYGVSPQGFQPIEGGPDLPPASLTGRRALAFAGIARPARFFDALAALGITPAARLVFPDHHDYPPATLAKIRSAAQSANCDAWITTAKDAVKIRGRLEPDAAIFVLKIRLDLPPEFFAVVHSAVRPSPPPGQGIGR